jgi:hypothetical protein
LSAADKARSAAAKSITGSPRFVAQGTISMPSLFGQNVTFSAISQNDLNPESDLIAEGSTLYAPERVASLTRSTSSLNPVA